jgi:hypothetical protein
MLICNKIGQQTAKISSKECLRMSVYLDKIEILKNQVKPNDQFHLPALLEEQKSNGEIR